MRSLLLGLAASGLLATCAYAQQPAYSAADIVKQFAPAPSLGSTRGLCIGTEADCGQAAPKPRTDISFDLVVNFEYNSDELTKAAKQNLDEFAKALKDSRLSTLNFVVEGHTDATGSADYNEGLSERRARSVTTFLTSNGIDPARIKATGLGEANPRNPNPFDPVNRRVEMRIRTE
jgi:outer membrane protein OmpA-like peptidoglycan-associated protein